MKSSNSTMRARPCKHLYRLVKLHPLLIANIPVALASKWLFIPQHDSCTQQLIRYYRLVSSFEKLSSETIEHARLESMKPLKRLPKVMNELMTKDASLMPCCVDCTWDWCGCFSWFCGFSQTTPMELQHVQGRAWETREWILSTMGVRHIWSIWRTTVILELVRKESWSLASTVSVYNLIYIIHDANLYQSRWRVLEISDIVIVVMDIRHPLLHFPRSLYNYVTKELKRKIVGVFNKVSVKRYRALLSCSSLGSSLGWSCFWIYCVCMEEILWARISRTTCHHIQLLSTWREANWWYIHM